MNETLKNRNVLVIGLGVSGQAAARFLLLEGAHVVGIDRDLHLIQTNKNLAECRDLGMKILPDTASLEITTFHLVVVSPGIPTTHSAYQAARNAGIEVIGEVELACRYLKGQKILGITGTNGKTTVTWLVTHVLNHWGKNAQALGNTGTPLSEGLLTDGIIVAELSSFQLETLQSPVLDAGVILNITPDHLDRYSTIEEYAKAKIHMQSCLKPGGKLFVEEAALSQFRVLFDGIPLWTYGYSAHCHFNTDLFSVFFRDRKEFDVPSEYVGKPTHDLENIMAAYALCCEMGIDGDQFCQALATFKKPPHRIEYVRMLKGVTYYDDSKGTNVDAVIRAVSSLPGKIVLIAGGVDKGAPYTPWIASFAGKVKQICAIGASAHKIRAELGHRFSVSLFESMEAAVKYASEVAEPNEHVLLSPGCSSYDMYKNYAHRGEEFQRLVHAL